MYVNLAVAHFRLEGFNLLFRGPIDDTAGVHVELRAMPGTLHRAADKGTVGKRASLVRTVIAESYDVFRAAAYRDPRASDIGKHQLAFLEIGFAANRLVPASEFTLAEFAGVGVAAIDGDLVAVDERASEPTGDAEHHDAHGGKDQGSVIRHSGRATAISDHGDEQGHHHHVQNGMAIS